MSQRPQGRKYSQAVTPSKCSIVSYHFYWTKYRLQCSTGQDLAQTQPDSYDIQPHFKQGEKYAVEPNQFAEKRSINEIFSSKKQVGVIYKNDYPIGILQVKRFLDSY